MINKLVEKIKQTKAPIVVGLDPMLSYVPEHITKKAYAEYGETLKGAAEAIWLYNRELIDHIHDLIPAVKPQDLKFQGEVTWLELGDDNRIREFATLHRGTEGGGGITRIGSRNLCMAYTHIAHDCQLGNDIVMSNGATLGGHVRVDDFAIIGGLSAVHQFGHVGTHAFVGGMTGVAQDLPPWMLAAGSRALVHGPNLVGLRRAGASRETISAFKQAFRLIWRSEMPRSEALDLLANDYANLPQVMEFVDFVRSSERGLCPAEKNVEKKLDDDAV